MNDMNRIDHNNYAKWVERFLDAETTLDEERELYAYFSRPDLPEDARKYRNMFGWYEDLTVQKPQSSPTAKGRHKLRILHLHPWHWAGIAAMIAVLFTIILSLRHNSSISSADDDDYIYASYIIHNGHKITDPETVRAEMERMEASIDRHIALIDSRMDKYEHPDVTIDTDNPEIRNFIETTLNF